MPSDLFWEQLMDSGICTYLQKEIKEALGDTNKWYASQYYGYEVTNCDKLIEYYIKHGGAQKFAELHRKEITNDH